MRTEDYASEARVFKALCDEKRLAILEQLRGGEKCACELLEQIEVTQSGLSYHMKILCESGIVEGRKEGKWMYYRLNASGQQRAAELLTVLTTPRSQSACKRDT